MFNINSWCWYLFRCRLTWSLCFMLRSSPWYCEDLLQPDIFCPFASESGISGTTDHSPRLGRCPTSPQNMEDSWRYCKGIKVKVLTAEAIVKVSRLDRWRHCKRIGIQVLTDEGTVKVLRNLRSRYQQMKGLYTSLMMDSLYTKVTQLYFTCFHLKLSVPIKYPNTKHNTNTHTESNNFQLMLWGSGILTFFIFSNTFRWFLHYIALNRCMSESDLCDQHQAIVNI